MLVRDLLVAVGEWLARAEVSSQHWVS